MNELYILGSGGFAKEVYALAKQTKKYEVKAFIDIENKSPIIIGRDSIPVLSETDLLGVPGESAVLAIGLGDPKVIAKVAKRFEGRYYFPNIIHPSVVGNFEDINLGVGNIFTANTVLTTSIRIGSFNIFNLSCTVGHDVIIGNYNVLNPCVNISGGVVIGDENLIGVNATVLQYKKIGSQATIGASSLVTKNVENNSIVIGIPAKKIEK